MRWTSILAGVVWLVSLSAAAQTVTIAVEDKDFAPYTMVRDGKATGACAEIAEATLERMGAKAEYVSVPWSRVLLYVENQKVDAALCGTSGHNRDTYSHYPDEALLYYDATLFVANGSDIEDLQPATLSGKTFGTIIGYSYQGAGDELERLGMTRQDTYDREGLIRQLLAGKVDAVLDSVEPMQRVSARLNVSDQIRSITPKLRYAPAYLFFSKKPGNEDFAAAFSNALKDFKETPEYWDIQDRFGF